MTIEREEILRLIPEIGMIGDAALREQTLTVWVEAARKGGWTASDLVKMPFTLLIKKVDVSLIDHTRNVTKTALKIAEALGSSYPGKIVIHRDLLLSGAILHDVGKLFEFKRDKTGAFQKSREGEMLRHPISGAAFAYKYDLPTDVVHMIAAHSKEGDGLKRTIEAIILNHADFVNFDIFKE
jgi:putative nucleotidyltransferase with HDIG domain